MVFVMHIPPQLHSSSHYAYFWPKNKMATAKMPNMGDGVQNSGHKQSIMHLTQCILEADGNISRMYFSKYLNSILKKKVR